VSTVSFEIVGAILDQETIAVGASTREVVRLRRPTEKELGGNVRGSPE